MTVDVEMEPMDIQGVSSSEADKKLSKTARRNLKRKAAKEAKKALKGDKPSKPIYEPRLPSNIVFPEKISEISLKDDELLAEIKKRISDKNSQTLRIMPVPKNCPPLLLQDLCPTSVAVRIPSKKNCRYAFVDFKTASEARSAAGEVNGKTLNGKPIKATICSERSSSNDNWKSLDERTLDDFDLSSLFISNLPRFTERTDLAQIFRTADKINFLNLPDGTCKGFCILKYRNRDEALKAFTTRHGTLYRGIPIYVNFEIKSKRKKPVGKKSTETELEPMETDQSKSEQVSVPSKPGNRKRRASEIHEDESTTTEVVLPVKKRRLENGDVEAVKNTKKDKVGQKATPKKSVESKKTKKSEKKVDSDFVIQKAPNKEPKMVKLQPYQLSKKKEPKMSKLKPAWK